MKKLINIKLMLLLSTMVLSNYTHAVVDCATHAKLEWIRVGETSVTSYNNSRSTVVVKPAGRDETVLHFGMNLDDAQGGSILGVLTTGLALGLPMTLRDNSANGACSRFDEVVIHPPSPSF